MSVSDSERLFYQSVLQGLMAQDVKAYSTQDLRLAYFLAALDGAIPGGVSGGVTSINSKTGVVTLAPSDVGAVDATTVGAASGIAQLGPDGKLLSSQMPALALDDVRVVASQAAMLALTGTRVGTSAIRTDDSNKIYLLSALPATTLGNWVPTSQQAAVSSVAGKTGAITLAKGDVGLGNIDNTSDANKPVSTAQQAAIDTAKAAVNPWAVGVRPRVTPINSTTWNTRASALPPGYSGNVDYDSMLTSGMPAPSDRITGDGWFKAYP